jgi:hypothetical protein
VFRGLAERDKTSVGWFFGFKVHLVFNDGGELLTFRLTAGNVDDRAPVPQFAKQCRKNMKPVERPLLDKVLLRKRAIVETIIDQLKNISQIEHTRHRSPINFLVNLVCA